MPFLYPFLLELIHFLIMKDIPWFVHPFFGNALLSHGVFRDLYAFRCAGAWPIGDRQLWGGLQPPSSWILKRWHWSWHLSSKHIQIQKYPVPVLFKNDLFPRDPSWHQEEAAHWLLFPKQCIPRFGGQASEKIGKPWSKPWSQQICQNWFSHPDVIHGPHMTPASLVGQNNRLSDAQTLLGFIGSATASCNHGVFSLVA